ncbi:MAG: hypothetical protein JSR37_05735 [Verrucomicrobia bacterium]|nr:hypothetical protein [Verrucomicrobiota bacterium]MBS0636864.1 hypothetical protein [Verrucomicrobiota bacterium]
MELVHDNYDHFGVQNGPPQLGEVHFAQGRGFATVAPGSEKVEQSAYPTLHDIQDLRTQKRELKQNVALLTERNTDTGKRVLNSVKTILHRCFPNLTFNPSKLEIAQKRYEDTKNAYQTAIESNPAAQEANKIKMVLKEANHRLASAGGEWEQVDGAFREQFNTMWKSVELFGSPLAFLGPKTQTSRAAADAFVDSITSGLEQLSSSAALKERSITWMHGTRSAAMGVMLETDHTLHPTGHLLERNIYPLSGELGAGISGTGVNRNNLSGTAGSKLGVKTTMEYSRDFVASQTNDWKKLSEKRIESICTNIAENPELEGRFGDGIKVDMLTTGVYIERLKVIDPDFKTNSQNLRDFLDKKIAAFPEDGSQQLLHWLQDMRARCDTPAFINPTEQIRELVTDSFPIVLASTRVTGQAVEGAEHLDEHSVRGGISLQNMAIAFTEPERVGQLRDLFLHAGLQIEVMDFNAFKAFGMKAPETSEHI